MRKSRCCSLALISVLLSCLLYHVNMVYGQSTIQTYTFTKVDRASGCRTVLSSSKQRSVTHCLLKCGECCFMVNFEASTNTCSLCTIQGLEDSENATGVAFIKVQKQTARNFIMITNRTTWKQAEDYCNTNYKGLAIISNDIELVNVQRAINESGQLDLMSWIGGVRINDKFVWASHDNGYIPMCWFHWRTGEPTLNEQKNCVLISAQSKWADEVCSKPQPFICIK